MYPFETMNGDEKSIFSYFLKQCIYFLVKLFIILCLVDLIIVVKRNQENVRFTLQVQV